MSYYKNAPHAGAHPTYAPNTGAGAAPMRAERGYGAAPLTQDAVRPPIAAGLSKLSTYAGGAMSLALVVGITVWGYGVIMRDVSGVPVVRAMEGPMRVAPETPGGTTADHIGLAVNAVPADGSAAPTPDQLTLAPKPVDLVDEDRPQSNLEAAPTPAIDSEAPAQSPADVMADLLARDVTPLGEVADTTPSDVLDATTSVDALPALSALTETLRPRQRPTGIKSRMADPVAAAVGVALKIDADSLPIGTRLAQLGAFDSAATAEKEWQRLSVRFSDYMAGKAPVIQEAQSGGRTFWRLRAHGFADLSDARRFCAALQAERAECIPVVTR
jgi:hypothetical protein